MTGTRIPLHAFFSAAAFSALFMMAGCAAETPNGPSLSPTPAVTAPAMAADVSFPRNIIRDIRDIDAIPQDLTAFAGDGPAPVSRDADRLKTLFFSAWQASKASTDSISYLHTLMSPKKMGYAENLLPWSEARRNAIEKNAGWDRIASGVPRYAVSTAQTSVRAVPTDLPRLTDPGLPGNAWPFDEFQESLIPVGFPLAVFRISEDGAWAYAESSLVCGWVRTRDIAFTDREFRAQWTETPLAACVLEDIPLKDENGLELAVAAIGTLLPAAGDGLVRCPVRGTDGNAAVKAVRVPAGSFVPLPLQISNGRIAELGSRMMGSPYGWGGMFGDRDCSMAMHDLFVPFGIWLPRNSAAQAKAGRIISLKDLSDDEKKQAILAEGIPFRTLIRMPGHIGLYIGSRDGEPLFFHQTWGLATKDDSRMLIGRAVITTLEPGKEWPDLKRTLLSRVSSITVIDE